MDSEIDNNQDRDKKKRNKFVILVAVFSSCTLICLCVTVWVLFFRNTTEVINPDYAWHEIEKNSEPMGDENDEKLEQPQGGGAVSITYTKEVDITLSNRAVALLFGNPTRSNQDMVLQIVVQGMVVVQSGRIEPGNQVTKLSLVDDVSLKEGVYEGKFLVCYYQRETGEKVMLNTEIPISISVRQ